MEFVFRPFIGTQPIGEYRQNLPHWREPGGTYFVTARLADSLPAEKTRAIKDERANWLSQHGLQFAWQVEKLPERNREEYHRQFTARMENLLDAGCGACPFRAREAQHALEGAMLHF